MNRLIIILPLQAAGIDYRFISIKLDFDVNHIDFLTNVVIQQVAIGSIHRT